MRAISPLYACNRSRSLLRNTTDSTNPALSVGGGYTSAGNSNEDTIDGVFTITDTKNFQVWIQVEATSNTIGFGVDAGTVFAVDYETYGNLIFEKLI